MIDQYDVVPADGGQVAVDQPDASTSGEATPSSPSPGDAWMPAPPDSAPVPTVRSSSDDSYHDDEYEDEYEDEHDDEHEDEHELEVEHEDD